MNKIAEDDENSINKKKTREIVRIQQKNNDEMMKKWDNIIT